MCSIIWNVNYVGSIRNYVEFEILGFGTILIFKFKEFSIK